MDNRWFFLLGLLVSVGLYGEKQEEAPVPPEAIEQQLEDAEEEFRVAKEMFNPWYAGPLLTPSAHILSPGYVNIQPYLFFTNSYGAFDKHGKSHSIPHIHTFNPQFIALIGILPWMDCVVGAQGIYNHQQGHSSFNWGDTSFSLNFGLMNEGPYNPALLIGVKETFPTGKYQHLNPRKNGVDATGAGSYQTTFSFNISKVIWWVSTHPMNMRLSLNYTVPSLVSVEGLNVYGGGVGTHGKVRPGNAFAGEFGYEYSFNQRWVLALDVVYTHAWKTTFSGHQGSNPTGAPFNDQLSLAPALEYNPNPNLGLLAGVWFTVWGRNSLNFVSGVLSATYTF